MGLMRKCDRCGGEILVDESSKQGWHYIRIDDDSSYDLCQQCSKHFVEFMKGRLFNHEERQN